MTYRPTFQCEVLLVDPTADECFPLRAAVAARFRLPWVARYADLDEALTCLRTLVACDTVIVSDLIPAEHLAAFLDGLSTSPGGRNAGVFRAVRSKTAGANGYTFEACTPTSPPDDTPFD